MTSQLELSAFERALRWEIADPHPLLVIEQAAALVGSMLRRWPMSPAETERLLRELHADLTADRLNVDTVRVERDFERAAVKPLPPRVVQDPREHGTMRGWRQHKWHDDPVCDECRGAYNADRRERARKRREDNGLVSRQQTQAPCGTVSAKKRHWARGEACEACNYIPRGLQVEPTRNVWGGPLDDTPPGP